MTANLRDSYRNNATSVLAADVTAVATTMTVPSGEGAQFLPATTSDLVRATITFSTTAPEIVRVTNVVGDTLTVVRGYDSTTGFAWSAGAKIERRLTASMLDELNPISADFKIKIATTHNGAGFAESMQIGAGGTTHPILLATSTGLITGYNVDGLGVVLGMDINATAADVDSITIGKNITNAADNSVVIGANNNADASAIGSVVVGYSADSTGASNVVIGTDSSAIEDNCVVLGSDAAATAGAFNAVAVGTGARVGNNGAIAVGQLAYARAAYSAATGISSEAWSEGSEASSVVPTIQREHGYFWHQGQPNWLCAAPVFIASPPVDLGIGNPWSTTTYQDNAVVTPTAPAGNEQYYLRYDNDTYDTSYSANNTITEAGTEPTWPVTAQGDTVAAAVGGNHAWAYVNPQAGIDISVHDLGGSGGGQVMFYPTRVGFICQKYVANTVKPTISVGNQSSATAYVNAQLLSGIGADNEVQWFNLTSAAGATNVIFKLDTRATGAGSVMRGRFVIEGIYMQLPG